MAKLFISPRAHTDLEVSKEKLKLSLPLLSPDMEIQEISEGNRLLGWRYRAAHGDLDGYLNQARQVVILDGDVRDCADSAVWYRKLVEQRYELAFYDDGYTTDVTLTDVTKSSDLADPFLGQET